MLRIAFSRSLDNGSLLTWVYVIHYPISHTSDSDRGAECTQCIHRRVAVPFYRSTLGFSTFSEKRIVKIEAAQGSVHDA